VSQFVEPGLHVNQFARRGEGHAVCVVASTTQLPVWCKLSASPSLRACPDHLARSPHTYCSTGAKIRLASDSTT
jgi:hypothetical protein